MNGLNGDLAPQDDSNNVDQTMVDSTTNDDEDNLNSSIVSSNLSTVLIVNNLTRPFTLPGLKKMLGKCGKIIDDKFWLNKDKTQCYVCYENEQIADESRQYINCLKWPASNPNTLQSTFGTIEQIDELIKKDEEERIHLENERRKAVELEAAKQEERKQQLKEELSKKFNDSLIGNESLIEQNGDSSINSSTKQLNNSTNNDNKLTKKDDLNESDKMREVSPARNPPTNVLFITNLERGFTFNKFKELLTKHGKLIDEKFWIDKLKSKCYVVYESNDDALSARNNIHGLKWPRANAKPLKVDFGKLSDVNDLLNSELKVKEDKSAIAKEIINNNNDKNKEINKDDKSEDKVQQLKETNLLSSNKPTQELKENPIENDDVRKKSPARNPISNIIYVRGLMRPFTKPQLKELLSKDGNYDEERFWIDKVKSQCYVAYENEEIASKTRDRLHRLTWPTGNHRKLIADFASEAELEEKLNLTKIDKASKEINEQIKMKDEHRSRERLNRISDEIPNETIYDKRKDRIFGRVNDEINQARNELHENNSNKRKRDRSISPASKKRDYATESSKELHHKDNHQVKESPGKTLETLFRKTKTLPSIYWIPLNEEDMKLRDEIREKQRLERIEKTERFERRKKEAEERFRSFNDDFNNIRRKSPPRRERSPYHPSNNNRHYGPPPGRNFLLPERNRYRLPPSRALEYSDKRMIDKPPQMRSPERMMHHSRPMRTPPRTPSRSPIRRTPDKQERDKKARRIPERNSRSASTDSSASSTKSSANSSKSSASSYRNRSRSPPARHQQNKRPLQSPRSPIRRHSRSPVRRSRSPVRHSRYEVDRRAPIRR